MNNEKINENVTDCFGRTQFSLSPAEAFLGSQRAKTRAGPDFGSLSAITEDAL